MSDFLSWNRDQAKSSSRRTLDFTKFLFLNAICPVYHAGFGYNLDEHLDLQKDSPLVLGSTVFPEFLSCEEADDDSSVEVNLTAAEKAAKEFLLPHKTIILRLRPRGESGWNRKPGPVKRTCFDNKEIEIPEPVDWYNLPLRSHGCRAGPFIGPLSERSYIKIIDPYDEIELRSEEKGSAINADDILFACRGLCCGPDRSVKSFTVLGDNGSTLILMAEIDNWST